VLVANSRGVLPEVLKSILEKVWLPEVTSGTFSSVFALASQVTEAWIWLTTSEVSAGSASLPMMKHALPCRGVMLAVGAAMARPLRRVRMVMA
jgi:hypothetical protein